MIRVPVKPTAWPEGRDERVSINSFGVGGANAHAILESASAYGVRKLSTEGPGRPRLIVLSGHNQQSLQDRIEDTVRYINSQQTSIRDLAYTLALRREHLNHRAFAVVHPDTPVDGSHFQSSSKMPSLPAPIFVFTGQGAQWAGMGKRLLETEPMFFDEIKKMDEVLQRLPDPPEWSLLGQSLAGAISARY